MTDPSPQSDHHVRRLRKPAIALGIGFVAAIPLLTPNTYIHNVLILTFLLAILASGWNIMSGFTGYISLGHSAFIGVGAYTSGILAAQWICLPSWWRRWAALRQRLSPCCWASSPAGPAGRRS